MAALLVRVSEDPARPLGHAIVTLSGLPRGLETFEFALSRHGFAANHLGPDGWQGAECWLQPEEAWFSGDVLKFVLHPDLVFQLENMPYQLAVRGQGLTGTAAVTFVWPLQLELEEGGASGERKVVGGTRVNPAPKPRSEPASDAPVAEPPLPLPEMGSADLAIPDVAIPEIGPGLDEGDEDRTRTAPSRPRVAKPEESANRAEEPGAKAPIVNTTIPVDSETARKAFGRLGSPASGDDRQTGEAASIGKAAKPTVPLSTGKSPALAESSRLEARPDMAGAAGAERRGMSGWLIGLLVLVVLAATAAVGWWWFSHQAGGTPPVTDKPAAPAGTRVSPEPRPAPEPIPAPQPKPAPEPTPAPKPATSVRPALPEPVVPVRPALPEPAGTPPVTVPATPLPPVAPSPPSATRPVPPVMPVDRERSAPPTPASPPRPGSGRSLEDELKSQFDPTVQELEKRLRPQKSP